MTVLVVASHPDDEVLGCGGTMARLADEGHEVYTLILGEGMTSRFETREQADGDLLKELHTNCHEAGRILGTRKVFLEDLPDNRFDTLPLLEIVKRIEKLLTDLQPLVVYTQHGGDLNVDHVLTYRAVLTATRPLLSCSVKDVIAYEVASSTEWAFQSFAPTFRPNIFVDIETTLERKLAAMQVYESEARAFPHPRSGPALEAIARRWGSMSGCATAEAFQLIRSVRR